MRTAGVVGETLLLDGLAVAAAAAFFFQNFAVLFEVRGDGDARQPPAEDSNSHA